MLGYGLSLCKILLIIFWYYLDIFHFIIFLNKYLTEEKSKTYTRNYDLLLNNTILIKKAKEKF